MTNYDTADYFTDASLIDDPFPYFEHLRAKGPVVPLPRHNVVAVTGYDEALAVFRDDEHFSSANAPSGPLPGMPFEPEGDDIRPQIEAHRGEMIYGDWLVTRDRPEHTAYRALLTGFITPPRLKKNEEFMWRLADRQIDTFITEKSFDFVAAYTKPYTILVVADLLGVPEEDHKDFCDKFELPPAQINATQELARNPLDFLTPFFASYFEERRRNPRKDGLSELAHAKFPDGTTPSLADIVNITTFLFGAGQDTSARLLGSSLRILAERPELQQRLRKERDRLPDFFEEVLRTETPVKTAFRIARVRTKVGEIEVKPGTTVALLLSAVNRDPRHFEQPNEFQLDRGNMRDHLAFGRGIHACLGAPLARAEALVSLQRLFDRTSDVRLDEQKHGPAGARRFSYEPTYLLRGLQALHLQLTPTR